MRALKKKRDMRSALADAPAGMRLVLHVGCGLRNPATLHRTFHSPEWYEVRLDINPDVDPDIIGTIVDMAGVDSESVDAVWSSHNLEHVYAHEVPSVLGEFHRVLRPGGRALVTMPDLQSVGEAIARGKLEDPLYESPAGPIAALDMLYGHSASITGGNEYMAHRTGFTAKTLTSKLQRAGFVDIRVTRDVERALWANAKRRPV
jgi:SAM-dependent methyltransferase